MKQYIHSRSWLRKTVAYILIAFGLFALVMPLVPGAVLAIIGFELIGIRFAFLERFYPGRILAPAEMNKPILSQEGSGRC